MVSNTMKVYGFIKKKGDWRWWRETGRKGHQEGCEGDKYVYYLLLVRVAGMDMYQHVHFKYGKFIVCQ